jgi:hypothetical protein
MPISVVLECGAKRTFARALDWPGWCRAGRDGDAALEVLGGYLMRYGDVLRAAGLTAPRSTAFEVVERLPGTATTDFGAPGEIATADHVPLAGREARRFAATVAATWQALAAVAAAAPAELRKGPRGGGRDRDAVVAHVEDAERSYARLLGVRVDDVGARRTEVLDAIRSGRTHERPRGPSWPPRYAASRIAWHVLDHAWEIQDRSAPA